jgi:hypothetical protein
MKTNIEHMCSNCKQVLNISIYPVINLQSDNELYNDLFSLELFKIECPKCKKTTIIQYDTFIVDMYKKYMIYMCINDNIYKLDKTDLINSVKKNNEYKKIWDELKYTRIVTSLNELLEKLLIFDYDLNDKVIEVLKLTLYEKERLDKELYTSIHFNKIERESLIFSCFNLTDHNVQPIDVSVDIKYYNIMLDKIGGLPQETGEFDYIDKNWAEEQLNK